jgi:hypothetical protein
MDDIKFLAMARGHLILADKDSVFYCDLVTSVKCETQGKPVPKVVWNSFTIELKKEKTDNSGDFDDGYKLKGLDDMGNGEAALVLEEQKNCYLSFVKFGLKQGKLVLN